jgi:hypothetical protein
MKHVVAILFLLGLTHSANGQDEYFFDISPEARALSKELKANARLSEKRFDSGKDVSTMPAWFVGSCHTGSRDYHVIAYYSSPTTAHIGVFHGDKQLANLWRFPYDARQFYVEGTRLMFAGRALLHEDTEDSWRQVPREVVIDFSAIPKSSTFAFRGNEYKVAQ